MKEYLYAVVIVRPDTKAVTAVVAGDRAYKGLSLSKVLEAGFLPVRETPMGGGQTTSSLILLEREATGERPKPVPKPASAGIPAAAVAAGAAGVAGAVAAQQAAPAAEPDVPAPPQVPTVPDEPVAEAQPDEALEVPDDDDAELAEGLEVVDEPDTDISEPITDDDEQRKAGGDDGEASDVNFDFLNFDNN